LGLKLAIASSSTRAWVAGHLERFGLLDAFECIKTSDDVRLSKPDPELYLAALACLGLAPRQAVAFEDSPNGLLAAKRAGLVCVVVPTALTSQLSLDLADLQVESLADMPLKDLLDLISKNGVQSDALGS
jgi:beta-phosphoglucomutase-like phosphatase (HAD superfamily)